MWISRRVQFRPHVFGIALSLMLAVSVPVLGETQTNSTAPATPTVPSKSPETLTTSISAGTMLLRTVSLDVSSYDEAKDLDTKMATADTALEVVNTSKSLLVHMEGLRKAYTAFGANETEKQKFMTALKDRYMKDPDNPEKFFDYGYAQVMMDGNKNGLFFLRKANDKIASPFTSLAYGLAQVDVDIMLENAPADTMTTRKMDAMYKLKDALVFNKDDMLPGVWPSYIHILEGLKSYPAYETLRNEDVTTIYVPYNLAAFSKGTGLNLLSVATGEDKAKGTEVKTASTTASETASAALTPSAEITLDNTCNFGNKPLTWINLAYSRAMDLLGSGKSTSINFFKTNPGEPYFVRVVSDANKVIGEFNSHKAPQIAEDIEGDGKYELVVRQYEKDPYHPLYVYRWNGSCYTEDKKISRYFK